MSARRFVLLDRDGTILVPHEYLSDPGLVELLPGAGSALRRLREAGWGLIVVTNQSAVGRGFLDIPRLERIHGRMAELLAREGAMLDGIYYCPHMPGDGCPCRKPGPGLALRAASEHLFVPRECVVVGDNVCDIRFGEVIGATTCLVRTGYGAVAAEEGKVFPDHIVEDILAASDFILGLPESLAIRPQGVLA